MLLGHIRKKRKANLAKPLDFRIFYYEISLSGILFVPCGFLRSRPVNKPPQILGKTKQISFPF